MLIDLLQTRASAQGASIAYRFLTEGDVSGPTDTLSYAELARKARTLGAHLQAAGARGERALLLYPSGLDFITAFFGCLFGAATAVPAYPPDPSRLARTLPRLRAIVRDCGARFVLTTTPILEMAEAFRSEAPELASLRWIATDALDEGAAEDWRHPDVTGETLAFLQYTSGSTGMPKGVMIRHEDIVSNQRMIRTAFGHDTSLRGVGWLPLYHDMGLIGNVLQTLFVGGQTTLLSPVAFLQRPLRWLEAISHFQGSVSGGPNFAFDLCARKATAEDIARLDLRSWTKAFNGAEPVRQETLERFCKVFEPCGFRRRAFYPCYGLAEATLFVAGRPPDRPPRALRARSAALQQGKVEPAREDDAEARALVSCGQPWLGQEVLIVHPERLTRCAPDEVGEIWVRGASVARGYWNRPEDTVRTFAARLADTNEGPFLRTGDLGFFHDGELYVTGRLKDLIVLHGKNHYPQDIEQTIERCHPLIRPGCCAAFSVEVGCEERLGVVAEVNTRNGHVELESIIAAIRSAIADEHDLAVHVGALLPPGGIPKTSSGKLQRHACKEGLLTHELEPLARWGSTAPAATPASDVYRSLPESCGRIDRRHTGYRFNLETDVRWDLLDAPGDYFGPELLAASGLVDVPLLQRTPEAYALFQWALALATCHEFIALEEGVLRFTAHERARLGPNRSVAMLEEEEHKHIHLFRRYADHLAAQRPALARRLRPVGHAFAIPETYANPAVHHYMTWLHILLFEEFTVLVHKLLLPEQERLQPAWLSAHAAHRQEELQHVVTDLTHLEALALTEDERWRWSTVFLLGAAADFRQMLRVEDAWRLVLEEFPELAHSAQPLNREGASPLLHDRALHRLLRETGGFTRTCKAAPAFAALAERPQLAADWRERFTRVPRLPRPRSAAEVQQWIGEWLVRGAHVAPQAVEATRSFAEYGLDSVSAVELAHELGAWLGVSLSPTLAWNHPTPERLAAAVARAEPVAPAPRAPVALQPSGSRSPFFCVHPAGGTVEGFRDLAALLGREQPFYGFTARGLERDDFSTESVEEMAASYLSSLRAIQPEGPYALGGWSFGGLVAFEMAHQLARVGQPVSSLVLLDTAPPGALAGMHFADDISVIAYLAAREGSPIDEAELRRRGEGEALLFFASVAARGKHVPSGASKAHLRRVLRTFRANVEALRRYRPQPYAGPVTLLRARDQEEPRWADLAARAPDYGWRAHLIGSFSIRDVPGSHFTMLRPPHVRVLAAVVREVLAEAGPVPWHPSSAQLAR